MPCPFQPSYCSASWHHGGVIITQTSLHSLPYYQQLAAPGSQAKADALTEVMPLDQWSEECLLWQIYWTDQAVHECANRVLHVRHCPHKLYIVFAGGAAPGVLTQFNFSPLRCTALCLWLLRFDQQVTFVSSVTFLETCCSSHSSAHMAGHDVFISALALTADMSCFTRSQHVYPFMLVCLHA